MKRIIKIFSINHYSFFTKAIFSFLIFVILFILFKTILAIPKIEEKAFNDKIYHISKIVLLTKDNLKIIEKSLIMQSSLEVKLNKQKIENELIKLKYHKNLKKDELIKYLKNNLISKYCSIKLTGNNIDFKHIKNMDFFEKNNTKIKDTWQIINENEEIGFAKNEIYFYNIDLKKYNFFLEVACDYASLNPKHKSFEMDLKKSINTESLIDSNLKTTKIAVVLLNPDKYKSIDEVVFEKNESLRNDKYLISYLSNVNNIPTGNITLKEFLYHKNEEKPISYKVSEKEYLTWVIKLSKRADGSYFFLIFTIEKKEIINKLRIHILLFFPETLVAIGISFLVMLFFFKRVLQNLNTLTKTAIAVNNGKKNIRSNVKGEDDIGILGKSFDSMLDFFEDSIDSLDKKVKDKTKEISKSLDEKDTLLKEIHHRVKNNLALTISFIELQEDEINDAMIKKVLVDIKERIYTMELIHRKLYESTSLNKIPFKAYLIDLANTISKTYNIKDEVLIEIDMEEIELDIQKAMPYGLILNELITNAFKYAFDDNKNPKLNIKAVKEEDDLIITIKDNGKGIAKGFENVVDKTLGLRLINTIVKYQLFGTFEYKYDNGSIFLIKGKMIDKELTNNIKNGFYLKTI